ncbi:MAG: hypothetical protein Q8S73_12640 [Deltaproteobacteria bacterium]|nr:hypothetical protein [Myxococcales bacterium]MDP3214947.1 hypothetical protein [Deltaproteobacteria bacterium]
METTTCPKCLGAKRFPQYANIANGDCFVCGATGRVAVARNRPTGARGAAEPVSAACALATLRVWYANARRHGAAWFADEGESGVGMGAVRWYAAQMDAATAGRVLAAFESLAAECT